LIKKNGKTQKTQIFSEQTPVRFNVGKDGVVGSIPLGSTARHLLSGNSPMVVGLDYSLNEPIGNIECLELTEGNTIQAYDFVELIAEKFRALLQQSERNRVRRQDVFDLHFILKTHSKMQDTDIKKLILERLLKKSDSRNLSITHASMADEEIKRRSREEYHQLETEIEGELPPFEDVYAMVEDYYRSLPWPSK
jgi:hypothetical protein